MQKDSIGTGLRTAGRAALALGLAGTSQLAMAWSTTATHAFPLKAGVATTALPAPQVRDVVVALKLQNAAGLRGLIAEQARPGSVSFGRFLTPEQFAAAYAPSEAQVAAVVDYLSRSGLTQVQVEPGRTLIRARGTAAALQAAFATQLAQVGGGATAAVVNLADAKVPDALGGVVLSVLGLNDLAKATPTLKTRSAAVPALNFSYDAAQFQKVYNAGATPTGANTVLGIVSAGGDLSQVVKDLRQYEAAKGLPVVPVRIVNVKAPGTDLSGDGEWALDSQSSSGVAGTLKELVFYNTTSLADADLVLSYNAFVSENKAKAVNMSFGGCETLNALLGGTAASDQLFMQAAVQGQTLFASSGDAGAACSVAINLGLPDSGLISVEFPASSPYVVAVGGTTLLSNTDYSYNTEVSWTGGGGGTSLFETAPSWQAAVAPLARVGLRAVPDIAMDADPNTGAELVVKGASTVIGGTSLSAPLSAGVWARIQSAHCNGYGFAAPLIYALHGQSGLLATATGFHDVILGTNGLWVATPGWDYTTGFGSMDITAVNAALPPVAGCTA